MKFLITFLLIATGVGVFVSPAWVPEMELWNFLGMIPLIRGIFLIGDMLERGEVR